MFCVFFDLDTVKTNIRPTFRLNEEMYNVDEVENMLASLSDTLQATVRQHMERTAFMAVLLVRQLLEGGASNDVDLLSSIHLPQLEDQKAISEIARIRIDAPPADKSRAKRRLRSVKDENVRLHDKVSDLETSNEMLREKCAGAEEQVQTLVLSQKNMKAQLHAMKKALKHLKKALRREQKVKSSSSSTSSSSSKQEEEEHSSSATTTETSSSSDTIAALLRDIDRANKRIGDADEELMNIRMEAKKRISKSKQFQQMKKLLQRKNEQLKHLRARLEKYEPDQVEEDDEREPLTRGK